jgi:hypothetical protein
VEFSSDVGKYLIEGAISFNDIDLFEKYSSSLAGDPALISETIKLAVEYNKVEMIEKILPLVKDYPDVIKTSLEYIGRGSFKRGDEMFKRLSTVIEVIPDIGESIIGAAIKFNDMKALDKMLPLISNKSEILKDAFETAINYNKNEAVEKMLPFMKEHPEYLAGKFNSAIYNYRDNIIDTLLPFIKDHSENVGKAFTYAVRLDRSNVIDKILPFMKEHPELIKEAFNSAVHFNNIGAVDKILQFFGKEALSELKKNNKLLPLTITNLIEQEIVKRETVFDKIYSGFMQTLSSISESLDFLPSFPAAMASELKGSPVDPAALFATPATVASKATIAAGNTGLLPQIPDSKAPASSSAPSSISGLPAVELAASLALGVTIGARLFKGKSNVKDHKAIISKIDQEITKSHVKITTLQDECSLILENNLKEIANQKKNGNDEQAVKLQAKYELLKTHLHQPIIDLAAQHNLLSTELSKLNEKIAKTPAASKKKVAGNLKQIENLKLYSEKFNQTVEKAAEKLVVVKKDNKKLIETKQEAVPESKSPANRLNKLKLAAYYRFNDVMGKTATSLRQARADEAITASFLSSQQLLANSDVSGAKSKLAELIKDQKATGVLTEEEMALKAKLEITVKLSNELPKLKEEYEVYIKGNSRVKESHLKNMEERALTLKSDLDNIVAPKKPELKQAEPKKTKETRPLTEEAKELGAVIEQSAKKKFAPPKISSKPTPNIIR